jgi:uncharacterized protein with GYD domain
VPKTRQSISGIVPTAGQKSFILPGFGPARFSSEPDERPTPHRSNTPQQEDIMHFCMTAQYTPKSLNAILENPKTNRFEAAKKMVEAAGGKLISMYSTAANGPGVLVIFDVPDPNSASAMSGVVIASGAVHNVTLTRLWTPDEVTQVRQKAAQIKGSYTPPGG